ncbi:MAG: hypothetical protein A2268_12840 [Candidatus Raymondbacteria bacterium RifOxyA12_full_50_37]|uniref:Type 4 fimbrial biogenesis protein PilO n=1 Tax=Candidatus Raymondbacteria bacterium RIFOXYD12_FULL_49_13 TaxID=1817890 RepID=A0A1F7FIX9_UNCRA|nr:MAG: hypothetical protein A2268_12840 [Candidatus Raymondbacteria bacterium RifOxyA12_full_50_37]OGJ90777.1 MAG: hypothetical protein A2248_02150 [Candidatus Raymondbacteria bacterium RIFOXYA2_FULL_49_16]OGJ91656.1 MAG: hypothetical protein A2350_00435 [Candidatus Raymondbacteria bacterium RifOxyB12_full_50_8]OGJ97271.1 MAG: hypothetical protein A2487_16340 [Candidatus Raymondbacteria bacterium RifOxyC12_full_50_8]OGJ97344.1 MAG: hypothetical protein A2453_03430 [Candidatus Raymondbacteria b
MNKHSTALRRNKELIQVAISGALLCVLVLFVVVPLASAMYKTVAVRVHLSQQSAAINQLLMHRTAIISRHKDYMSIFSDIQTATDGDEKPSLLFNSLNTIALRNGVRLQSIKPEKPAVIPTYSEIPFTVTVNNTYHETALFVNALEKSGHVVKFSEIHCTPLRPGNPSLKTKMNISFYVLK